MNVFRTAWRLLTFRLTRNEMLAFNWKHFVFGLLGTWIVGMGRYWDDEGATTLQQLGLGSVIYIFLLALFIWVIILPFKEKNWNYFMVLTFISLTSFPAIFYAIPVEKYYSVEVANKINVWFLSLVALWRLCLLFFFLSRFTGLRAGDIITVTLLPICLIIAALTALNLHRAVFDIMGGRRETTPHDDAYAVLNYLTIISIIFVGPLLISYVIGIVMAAKRRKKPGVTENQN